jgi:hypothetical protein
MRGGSGQPTANGEFTQELTKWAFQEMRVLRIATIDHHLAAEPNVSKESYTINDRIVRHSHLFSCVHTNHG